MILAKKVHKNLNIKNNMKIKISNNNNNNNNNKMNSQLNIIKYWNYVGKSF